jgi:hypothetical protein
VIPHALSACWISCAAALSVPKPPKPPPAGRVKDPDGRVNDPDGLVNDPDGRVNDPDGRVKDGTAIPAAFRQAATVGSENGFAAPAARPRELLELAAAEVVAAARDDALVDELPPPQATTPTAVDTTMPVSSAGRIIGCISRTSLSAT